MPTGRWMPWLCGCAVVALAHATPSWIACAPLGVAMWGVVTMAWHGGRLRVWTTVGEWLDELERRAHA